MTFIASTMHRMSPFFTLWPTSTKLPEVGEAARNDKLLKAGNRLNQSTVWLKFVRDERPGCFWLTESEVTKARLALKAVCVRWVKEVTYFAPGDYGALYARPEQPELSTVDLEAWRQGDATAAGRAERARHPRFAEATAWRATPSPRRHQTTSFASRNSSSTTRVRAISTSPSSSSRSSWST